MTAATRIPPDLAVALAFAEWEHGLLGEATTSPQTDDELHAWLVEALGFHVPRTAVCPDHDAPFAFISDFFFHRVSDAIILANRGGGKTEDIAALHIANARWKPGFDTSHIGAIDIQAKRCYAYYKRGLQRPALQGLAPDPHIRETLWQNGSWIEILPGTEAQTQGGHPRLVAYDELESGKYQPYENAKAMPSEWRDGDVTRVGQFLAASTRVTGLGMMQQALDEATKKGKRVYTWCIFDTMAKAELPPEHPFWQWLSPDGLASADGWRSLADVEAHYERASQDTWEAQYLCLKPEARALIYANFGPANVTEEAEYVEGGGPIQVGYDWGFTDPTHIVMLQYRNGAWWQFDELRGSNRPEREWVREVIKRAIALPGYNGPDFEGWVRIWEGRDPWPSPWPEVWPIMAAGDPSAVQLRAEFREHGVGARKPATVKHQVLEGQDVLRAAISTAGGLRRYFIHPRCRATIEDLTRYRARQLTDGTYGPQPDPDPANHAYSHGTDAPRYLFWTQRRALGLSLGGTDDDSTNEAA